jgi:hypothetical protein
MKNLIVEPSIKGAREKQLFGLRKDQLEDVAIAILLFVFTVILLSQTSLSIGFTRDEGYYFKAAELYFGWFRELYHDWAKGDFLRPFTKDVIDRHWKYNHEHPVLVKSAFALSWGVLKQQWGLFDLNSSAFRFPAWLFSGLSVSLVYAFGRALLPRRTALIAAVMWLSIPRVFWQMHLACFDIPVCAAHLWLVYAYWKGRWSLKGAIGIGVAFGLAISVKHNVLVAPAFFVLHWLLVEAKGFRRGPNGFSFPALPIAFFSLAIVGPLVFLLHWPYLWSDIIGRVGWYLGFHLKHEHYPILWFGELLSEPPFPISFPFVMSAVTIPIPVMVVMLLGTILGLFSAVTLMWSRVFRKPIQEISLVPLGAVEREGSGSPALLLLLNVAFPFALIALPFSPIFGGTKHWMNALPFLCILGAWAIEEGLRRLAVYREERALQNSWFYRYGIVIFLGLGIILPGVLISSRVHPYGLASYNGLVGYARGAANVGFQRTFWGYEPRLHLPFVNANAPKNGRIHFGDTNLDDFKMYRRDGLLRKDLRYSGRVSGSNIASVQPQGEFKEQWIQVLNKWGVNGPDAVVHVEGVPLVTITMKPQETRSHGR